MSKRYKILDATYFSSMRGQIGMVAIETETGWRAYLGTIDGFDEDYDQQQVAQWGAKVPIAIACAAFPRLNPEQCEF